MTLPNASQHLAVLRAAGLVAGRRRGTSVVYRLAEPAIAEACDIIHAIVGRRLERAARPAAEPAAGPALRSTLSRGDEMSMMTAFTFGTRLPGTIASVRPAVEAALGRGIRHPHRDRRAGDDEGQARLDRAPFVILGACNPQLAHRALEADPSVGALLPCNVVLREDGAQTIVEALDPMAALGIVDAPEVRPVAEEARARLERVIAALEVRA